MNRDDQGRRCHRLGVREPSLAVGQGDRLRTHGLEEIPPEAMIRSFSEEGSMQEALLQPER